MCSPRLFLKIINVQHTVISQEIYQTIDGLKMRQRNINSLIIFYVGCLILRLSFVITNLNY